MTSEHIDRIFPSKAPGIDEIVYAILGGVDLATVFSNSPATEVEKTTIKFTSWLHWQKPAKPKS